MILLLFSYNLHTTYIGGWSTIFMFIFTREAFLFHDLLIYSYDFLFHLSSFNIFCKVSLVVIAPCLLFEKLFEWVEKFSHVQLFATAWTMESMKFSRHEYWGGQPFPSLGDLPNPGIEPRSCRQILYQLSYQGSPRNFLSPLQFWIIILLGWVFLVVFCFLPFSTLAISCQELLACKVYAEKSAIDL